MKRALSLLFISASTASIISCGSGEPATPQIANGAVQAVNSKTAQGFYQKAKNLEAEGKIEKAAETYGHVAHSFPLSSVAAESRFRQATLLDNSGQKLKAFDAYQAFIEKHNSSKLYSSAIKRQYEVAIAAAEGTIENKFFGIKSKHSATTAEKMLRQCKANAPFSVLAPKAEFAVGQLHQTRGDAKRAIQGYKGVYVSYPESELAGEARYRAGTLLIDQVNNGNRNIEARKEARNVLADLVQISPNHPRVKEAKAKIATLDSSGVQDSFKTAEFYRNKGQNQAAMIYYKDVMKEVPSGQLHEIAKQRIAELSQ